jgi:hypothetical protein
MRVIRPQAIISYKIYPEKNKNFEYFNQLLNEFFDGKVQA